MYFKMKIKVNGISLNFSEGLKTNESNVDDVMEDSLNFDPKEF